MSFFISDAFAQGTSGFGNAGTGNSPIGSIVLLVGFVIIFYFLFIRPQSKRTKEHRDLLAKLQPEDEVATAGGLMGVVKQVEDDHIVLTIASNVHIKIQKPSIVMMLPKGSVKLTD